MTFHLLPSRQAGAAENMAVDFLLLRRYPHAENVRFRHYGWHRPAFTFGFSQKVAFVRSQLPSHEPVEICRRFTGGGVVDHREDWTYLLVIPRGHPLEAGRAIDGYRAVHEALADALRAVGQPADTQKECEAPSDGGSFAISGVCFTRAELYDVINPSTGAKIAGAAQKRNKHGLALQGSIWRPAAQLVTDWEAFLAKFAEKLAAALQTALAERSWPEFNEGEVEGLTETYSSPEWIEQR